MATFEVSRFPPGLHISYCRCATMRPQLTSIIVELLNGGHIKIRTHRFIHELDCCNCWVRCVVITDLVEHILGLGDGITLSPINCSIVARIVESVLGARSYTQSDDLSGPVNTESNSPPCKSIMTINPAPCAQLRACASTS